jgi:putative tricarboxylic transport membrane protein
MSEASEGTGRGPSQRGAEIGVAAVCALFASIVIYGSWQVGINWAFDGPRAGFFPFYVGLIILGCSITILAQAVLAGESKKLFAEWSQLRSVMSVVIPTAVYVVVMPFIGIYVSSFFLIAGFMKWLGRYKWGITLAIAIGVPVVAFILFEKWFLVPLPKGPLEYRLGL